MTPHSYFWLCHDIVGARYIVPNRFLFYLICIYIFIHKSFKHKFVILRKYRKALVIGLELYSIEKSWREQNRNQAHQPIELSHQLECIPLHINCFAFSCWHYLA